MDTKPANWAITTVVLCVVGIVSMGLFRRPPSVTLSAENVADAAACGASGMLDVIVQGPFVIDNSSGTILLMGPDVGSTHDRPQVIDQNIAVSRALEAGDYSLSIGGATNVGTPNICNPVANTQLLTTAAKSGNLKTDPDGIHYFAVTLPVPTEIVPWNADPMWTSKVSPVPTSGNPSKFATTVILRYPYTSRIPLTFQGAEEDGSNVSYTLTPVVSGSESLIAIRQSEHEDMSTTHAYARTSFKKMVALESPLRLFVKFPPDDPTIVSNQPLIPGVEPKDLTDYLSAAQTDTSEAGRAEAGSKSKAAGIRQVYLLHLHNDCKAAILFADFTQ
jgi:hypothetical protein